MFSFLFPPSPFGNAYGIFQHVVDAPPLSVLADKVASQGGVALDFALCLALNHTVMLEEDPRTGKKQMQAESPDEEALVDGAKVGLIPITRFLQLVY